MTWTHRKELLARLALVAASVVCAAALMEVVLRTTHVLGARVSWSTPDSLLGYRFVPGSRYWFNKENDHPISGTINNYGWRDRDWTPQKSPSVHRVAVLGDSFVEALQVEQDSTFLRHAERQLADREGIQAEIMNFGRSGYTQTHQLLILDNNLLPFAPDLVVLCFLPGNDIADVRRETAVTSESPFFVESAAGGLDLDATYRRSRSYRVKSFIDPIKRRSALLSLATERYNAHRLAQAQRAVETAMAYSTEQIGGVMSLCTATPEPRFTESYRWSKRLLQEAASRGVPVMLVCMTSTGYRAEVEHEYQTLDPTFDAFFFENDMREFAAATGMHYMGLQTAFRKESLLGTQLHWDHWNYAGHRLAGGALARALAPVLRSARAGAE